MRVLISGYFGFGNAGDEAILSGMLRALSPRGVEAVVISGDPAGTEALHGARSVGRDDWAGIVRELRRAGVFVSGGGGLIQDRTSRRSALYYLGLLGLAQRMGVPTYIFGQGVGPVETKVVRAAARLVLPRVLGAGARDRRSAGELVRLGLSPERVQVTADAAHLLPPVLPEESGRALRAAGVDENGPRVGVVWRSPDVSGRARPKPEGESRKGRSLAREVASAVIRWTKETGGRAVVLPMHRAMDLDEAGAIADHIVAGGVDVRVLREELGFQDARAILAGVDLAVSVRYHGLLFAAAAGVPCVGLAYDPKVTALAEEFGFETLPLHASGEDVYGAMERAWEGRREFKVKAAVRAAALRSRAERDAVRCIAAGGRGGP